MADIDLATKLLNIKKSLQAKETEKIKLQTKIDVLIKNLKEKYELTPEKAKEEITKLEKKIKIKKENIKNSIKEIEEKYDLS